MITFLLLSLKAFSSDSKILVQTDSIATDIELSCEAKAISNDIIIVDKDCIYSKEDTTVSLSDEGSKGVRIKNLLPLENNTKVLIKLTRGLSRGPSNYDSIGDNTILKQKVLQLNTMSDTEYWLL